LSNLELLQLLAKEARELESLEYQGKVIDVKTLHRQVPRNGWRNDEKCAGKPQPRIGAKTAP
jgi:hypothetical protein